MSDCWKAYQHIGKNGYGHQTVNHSKHFKDPVSGCWTNTIEGQWRILKKDIPGKNYHDAEVLQEFLHFEVWKKQCHGNLWVGILDLLKEVDLVIEKSSGLGEKSEK